MEIKDPFWGLFSSVNNKCLTIYKEWCRVKVSKEFHRIGCNSVHYLIRKEEVFMMKELKPIKEGKVREIYDNGDSLIMVATDRISCFDVILNNVVTKKGTVLTQMSKFWFDLTEDILPNHMISVDVKDMPEFFQQEKFDGNSMMCRKLEMLPIECIVRGYITGSGWASYQKTGKVCGIELPEGLKESDKLPEPIYTPSTKAEIGDHDENISYEQSIAHLEKYFPGKGAEYAEKLRDYTIALYKKCADYALSKGIIIADTKFEFGLDENGNIVIGDEMLTPDSSRFWPADGYEPGHGQPSFDKQFARDWLKANDGNHNWTLPQEIVDKTIEKYLQAYEMLTGKAPWQTELPDCSCDTRLYKKIVKKAREAELLFPEELLLTDEQQNTLKKVLALDYEKRYYNVEAFKKGLDGEIAVVEKTSPIPVEQENASSWDEKIKKQTGNGFADVAGMEEVKQIFYKDILFLLKNKEKVERYKLKIPNGALLYGPPGCGKTYIAEKFAQESGLNFMMVKASDLGSIYIHGTQGKIAELFDEAEKKAPTVICFDEFDAMVPDRSRMDNVGQSGEVNEFLSQLNNCAERGIFVIGTSNRPDRIDPAVLRTGRIDKLIYIPLPDKEARKLLFVFQLRDRWCEETIDCEILADKTAGYVASDITFIVNETALTAAMKDIPISQELLMDEIGKARQSVNKEQIEVYESMYARLESGRIEERRRIGFATYK